MLVELNADSQVTLPEAVLEHTGITSGDLLEVTERDGGIFLLPVVVTPKNQQASSALAPLSERREILRSLCGSIDDPTLLDL